MTLARYDADEHGSGCGRAGPVHLVTRTAPAWADAGQRISLALWTASGAGTGGGLHPHPRPNRRYRLDLHRHLWDAGRSEELRIRSGADRFDDSGTVGSRLAALAPPGCAVDRWADEAGILLHAHGSPAGAVLVRAGARRIIAELPPDGEDQSSLRVVERYPPGLLSALPVLPDAATWTLPDLELLRAGAITADQLHPLVAAALEPGYSRAETWCGASAAGQPRWVECRGERHRIGLADGVLTALDHDPAEIRREELLVALTGTPLPCLQAIDRAHRQPDCISGVRERLAHGDVAGALAVVDGLVGPDAALRSGALLDELEAAAQQRITYGLFQAGLSTAARRLPRPPRKPLRSHPRHAASF
ncbi:hypothetical protein [Nocardia tengchongensis]|uniref:hypothetical protein n=1 Tax=Nocardia tengchongensis TaxID=2055889 RepID=UPI0036CECDEF